MNKAELAQNHPELLAQIQAEARAEGEKAASAEAQTAAFALVAAVAGEDVADKARKIAAAGMTAEQVSAMSAILGPAQAEKKQETTAANGEEKARADMLAAITTATGGAVATGGEVQKHAKSALIADAERRASAQRTV